VDLALPRGILSWLSLHPDDVLGVWQPGGYKVHSLIDKGAGVRAVDIGNPERKVMVDLLHVYQLLPVGGTCGHAAAALGMGELPAVGAVFLHAVKLEDALLVGMANNNFSQFSSCCGGRTFFGKGKFGKCDRGG